MTLPAGSHLGPYEIVALIGAGGMGEVYKAHDTRLDRTVAIKILPAHLASAPGFLDRFEREARAISAVEHPHICTLYDIGADRLRPASGTDARSDHDGEVHFLVLQYADGETLADRIRRGPIPTPDAVALARQIAAGLDAAHERGILHRDLKPSNIMLTSDAGVKILDFGLAKAAEPAGHSTVSQAGGSPTFTAEGTALGVVLGTAGYMSPEQARGKPLDKRTDIWAFGCVLYEILSGRPAFRGESVTDVLAHVVGREPDWTALPADTPPRVRILLRRCLQKDPGHRLRDIGDARLELDEGDSDAAVARTTALTRGPTILAWTIAGLATLVAAGSLATLMRTRSSPITRTEMRFSTVTNFAGVEAQPSLSPDGRSVAFVSNREGQWDIYVGLVSGGNLIRITNDPHRETWPRWSPDGAGILFSRLNEEGLYDVWVAPALSGVARRIVRGGSHPNWSRDGRSIVYSANGSLWLAESSGANPREVTHPEAPFEDYHAAFSHDGRTLAFVRRRFAIFGAPYGALAVVDVASGAVKERTGYDASALSPVWSPNDQFIYFTSSRGGAFNVWKIAAASGDPEQITAGQGDDTDIDLSADGTRLVLSSFRLNINLAEVSLERPTLGRVTWLTRDSARGENQPQYSPDGRRVAYFSNRAGAEHESIWVMDADGAHASRLVEDTSLTNIFPRWTGDGQELVFISRRAMLSPSMPLAAVTEVRRVPLAGGAPETVPIKSWSPVWGDVARDGRLVYRTSANAGEIYDPRTKQTSQIPDLKGDPAWSHDGRSFAFAVRPGAGGPGDAGLWIQRSDGSRLQLFRGWVVWIAWTTAGDVMFLEGKPDLKGALWRVADGGQPRAVLSQVPLFMRNTDVPVPVRFDVHPDGRRIVIEMLESFEADIGVIDNVR